MIRCVDVHKTYRTGGDSSVQALRGLDLHIEEPGFYAIMGASGSGKSTLLHLLAALDTPDSGEIHVGGRRIDNLEDRELTRFRRRDIGIVFQQFNLLPTLTAQENVELPGLLAGEPRDWLSSRSAELLQSLGLADRARHRPDALSGGEQQRVAIARALLFSPTVLFADEPTGNLDSRSSETLWRVIADIAKQHEITVIMVTHEPAAAIHCRAVYVLTDGRISGRIETDGMNAGGLAT
ncbi:MAG: ABC transporter ATP-binding protein, partial [Planctomycetota bacterium]|nr:ABC transporter ATP-binding protein [Planctomycetota bacterium]